MLHTIACNDGYFQAWRFFVNSCDVGIFPKKLGVRLWLGYARIGCRIGVIDGYCMQ
ncbi:hypothetical protein [Comamonas sp. SCN 65-56]|uniref:hypothetical protein n=1 Tax=Comamonas sp. SCN 65-56 TaxID=1660095 RepID=UPI0025B7DA54|nr:hypothetical protein [Comamonas sp. SCN 65-56]